MSRVSYSNFDHKNEHVIIQAHRSRTETDPNSCLLTSLANLPTTVHVKVALVETTIKMSKQSQRSKDRFETRYNSMKIANKGENEIYNVMLERLSSAVESGDVKLDNSQLTHAEKAHVLLQRAASRLAARQEGSRTNISSSSGSARTPRSRSRQASGVPAPKMLSRREPPTPDFTRRRYERDGDDDDSTSSTSDDDGKTTSDSSYSEESSHSDNNSNSNMEGSLDESGAKREINMTRTALNGAASRIRRGDPRRSIHNEIYDNLLQELDLKDEEEEERPMRRSERRASAAAGIRPILERGPDQVSRRAFAADKLTADKSKEHLPSLIRSTAKPSERRSHALEILKHMQHQKQQGNHQRRSSLSEMPKRQNADILSAGQLDRSSSSRQSGIVASPVPSLASSAQSHGSVGSSSRDSSCQRNQARRRRPNTDDQPKTQHHSRRRSAQEML